MLVLDHGLDHVGAAVARAGGLSRSDVYRPCRAGGCHLLRRSFSAVMILSVERTFSWRSTSSSTFGRYATNVPRRFALAVSTDSCAT